MKYSSVSVKQNNNRNNKWQATAKYKDVYGKWKEANRMAKEWLDQLNAEADWMPNAGKAKTVDEIYKEYLLHQVSTGEIERSTYSNTLASVKLKDTFNDNTDYFKLEEEQEDTEEE